jgi:16S rRNA G1207 methylase RsmC
VSDQPADPYLKKTVEWTFQGRRLQFRVSQSLFSSHEIDRGSRLLLRSIAREMTPSRGALLDLGCGYGPIGIALRAAGLVESVDMVDRDALAVEYAAANARLNGLTACDAFGSLGYDDLGDRQYDLIAMNVPGKAGERVIRHLLLGAAGHLQPDGHVAVVAVSPLSEFLLSVLAGEPAVELTYQRAEGAHFVAHFRFRARPHVPEPLDGFSAGIYTRGHASVETRGRRLEIQTSYGLPEFDTPSFATALLQEALEAAPPDAAGAAVLNPGQGFVPVTLAGHIGSAHITLAGRDLLALRTSRGNLGRAGVPSSDVTLLHDTGLSSTRHQFDVIAGVLPGDDGTPACVALASGAAARLSEDSVLLCSAASTVAVRVMKELRRRDIAATEIRRRKGHAVFKVERR